MMKSYKPSVWDLVANRGVVASYPTVAARYARKGKGPL